MIWAQANANLALVKYWGKAEGRFNQAANASMSVTLEGLVSAAGVRLCPGGSIGQVAWSPAAPVEGLARFVAHSCRALGIPHAVDVVVTSNFPVGAGLASSASAYAALAWALAQAAGKDPSEPLVTALARSGSGSACRSLYGGFVEWLADTTGTVRQVAPESHWPLEIVIAVICEKPKRISSREGMMRTAASSPFYESWLEANPLDLRVVREAVLARDLAALGPVVERNAMRMHATGFGADPPILYWEPATIAVIREVWRLRESGVSAFFSIDAGPQVKVFCEPACADHVASAVGAVPGVVRILRSRPGSAPRLATKPPDWALVPPHWQERIQREEG